MSDPGQRWKTRKATVAATTTAALLALLAPAAVAQTDPTTSTTTDTTTPTTTSTIPPPDPIVVEDPLPITTPTTTPTGTDPTPPTTTTPRPAPVVPFDAATDTLSAGDIAAIVAADPVAAQAITDIGAIQAELALLRPRLSELTSRWKASTKALRDARSQLRRLTDHKARVDDQLGQLSVASYVYGSVAGPNGSSSLLPSPEQIVDQDWANELSATALEHLEDMTARLGLRVAEAEDTVAAAERYNERAAQERSDARDRARSLEHRLGVYERRLGVDLSQVSASFITAEGMAFPVAEPYSFIDSFGAYRAGPPVHSHQGADIMAPLGTHAFAIESGTVELTSSGLGGLSLWVIGDSGTAYYYAHFDRYAEGLGDGQRVSVGQMVGYVGSSGNATAGAEHVHFEVHPGGRSADAVDPYPLLLALSNAGRGARQNA